jgi:hypothetical protein
MVMFHGYVSLPKHITKTKTCQQIISGNITKKCGIVGLTTKNWGNKKHPWIDLRDLFRKHQAVGFRFLFIALRLRATT